MAKPTKQPTSMDRNQIIEALVGMDVESFPNIRTMDGDLIKVKRVTSYSQGDEVFRVVPIKGRPIKVAIGDIAALE